MSNHELGAVANRPPCVHARSPRRGLRALVAGGALLLGLGGLAACGGDDDGEASDTVSGPTDELAADTSGPASVPDTEESTSTTRAAATTRPSTTAAATTTVRATTTTGATQPATSEPAPGTAETPGTATTSPGAAISVSGAASSVPGTDGEGTVPGTATTPTAEPGSTLPPGTGPTATDGECEFVENDEFPIERCNVGPAVRALQSVLQTLEYEIGTVDCFFGDQTLEAVRAFQTDQELEPTGVVDEETWAALAEFFLNGWGTDTNGNDLIEPNEITLECA